MGAVARALEEALPPFRGVQTWSSAAAFNTIRRYYLLLRMAFMSPTIESIHGTMAAR